MSVQLSTVTMQDGSSKLKLESPFHPALSPRVKALGGKWNAERKVWYIPADVEAQVREICRDIYGIDPLADNSDLVTVRWNAAVQFAEWRGPANSADYFEFGRQILRRLSRDSAVRPGEGVSILGDGFERSGGSRNYPNIGRAKEGTTLMVRDVPHAMAEAFAQENSEYGVEIIAQDTAATPAPNPLANVATPDLLVELARRLNDGDPLAQAIANLLEKETA